MTRDEARNILQTMMDGIDPVTGEILPSDHFCNDPEVMRALHLAIMGLSGDKSYVKRNGKLDAGRPWTKEDSANLAFLYRSGASMEKICEKLQRRERGVRNQLEYLGILKKEPEYKEWRMTGLERIGTTWTKSDEVLLERMYKENRPIYEIAYALGRTEYAVYCRMERLGLFGPENGYPEEDELPIFNDSNSEKLTELFEEGQTAKEIAAYFGRTIKSINARLFYMGLTKDSPIPNLLPRKK